MRRFEFPARSAGGVPVPAMASDYDETSVLSSLVEIDPRSVFSAMRFPSVAVVAVLSLFFVGAGSQAFGQRLEPYQTYAETGLSLNYAGYVYAEDAHLISSYNGFENRLSRRALRDSYVAFHYGQNAYSFLHPNKYIQARDAAFDAARRSYVNFDYLWTYVLPFNENRAVYDFSVATYYSFVYNYYAAVYYDAAFFTLIP